MYDLAKFTLSDMTRCGVELRKLGANASSMEVVAQRTVRFLYDTLRSPETGEPSCALVRFFVSQQYGELDAELQGFARSLLGSAPPSYTKCLTLLATAGALPAWNSRHASAGHKALPLTSEDSIARSPMIAQLIRQFGVDVGAFVAPEPTFMVDVAQHNFNVFHVPEALGSPSIPAQKEFVEPFGVRSVLGFGGLLPGTELFAIIIFSKQPIPRSTADLFRPLALNTKVAVLPFAGERVFS
jgi:hypothetical protein